MLEGLRAFPRILLEHWPALAAWYMAGGVVRLGIMYAAAPLSSDQPVLALLFLPLAVLARLIAYVAMFLTVRRSLPGYRTLEEAADEPRGAREIVRRFLATLFPAIAPFALVYGLVGGIQDDLTTYARITFRYNGAANGYGIGVGTGPVVIAIIVIAFLGRQALSRFGSRLPSWSVVVETYLESTWTFVAVTGLGNLLGGAIAWFQDRQVVALVLDTREGLVELWHGWAVAFEGIDGLVPVVAEFVLKPIAWILVAGLIYIGSLTRVRAERIVPLAIEARARARLALLPRPIARIVRGLASDWDEVYKPVVLTTRMARAAGGAMICVSLAGLGMLFAIDSWVTRGVVLVIGPHELDFWQGAVGVLNIIVSSVMEPIRIALLASILSGLLAAHARGRSGRQVGARVRGEQQVADR